MISHFVSKDAQRWDEYLAYAVMAYRSIPHTVTKFSPNYLVFGREVRLPIEDDLRLSVRQNASTYDEHVLDLAEKLKRAHEVVRKANKDGQQRSKKYYDKGTKLREFNVGDLVYLLNPAAKHGPSRKFAYRWEGPYPIVEMLSQLNYKIDKGRERSVTVHVNRLKKCKISQTSAPQRESNPEPNLQRPRQAREQGRESNQGHNLREESDTARDGIQQRYCFRSRPVRTDAQIIQELIGEDLDSSSSEAESESSAMGGRPASPDRVAPQSQGRPLPTLNERDPLPHRMNRL